MNFRTFDLERYFAKYEFNTKYILCASDAEALTSEELLSMASEETRKEWYSMKLTYTESQGNPKLLQAISNMYNDYYISSRLLSSCKVFSHLNVSKVNPSNVLLVTPEEGILLATMAMVEAKDHVIIIAPAYQSLYENSIQLDCNVDYWEVELNSNSKSKTSEWYLSLEKLKNMIKPGKTKCIIVNFPHNPTGYILPQSLYVGLIDLCRKYDLWLFSDEMYSFLWDNSNINNGNWLPSACMVYEKSITLCGMSKTFAMPGVRLGWLITQNNDIFTKMSRFKDYTTICSSMPSELLTLMALETVTDKNGKTRKNWEYIMSRTMKNVAKNEKALWNFIYERNNNDLFEWTQGNKITREKNRNGMKASPFGGETIFIRLKGKAKEIGCYQFCEQVVRGCGVMLAPSVMFNNYKSDTSDGQNSESFVRIGLGRQVFEEALDVLHQFLKKWRNDASVVNVVSKL